MNRSVQEPKQTLKLVRVRWMVKEDLDAVFRIENESFEYPWQPEDFVRVLLRKGDLAMVAEIGRQVAGFIVYEVGRAKIHVLNLAVSADHRRRGVGRAMVDRLKENLVPQGRSRITLEIGERNLDGQLFFREQGFVAEVVLRGWYEEWRDEDAYGMIWRRG